MCELTAPPLPPGEEPSCAAPQREGEPEALRGDTHWPTSRGTKSGSSTVMVNPSCLVL